MSASSLKDVSNYEMFRNMPKHDDENAINICMENFNEQDLFKQFMTNGKEFNVNDSFDVELSLCLSIIKINVIEEMKYKLKERDTFFSKHKSKRKFRMHPRILEGLNLIYLGNDENSFFDELKNQKDQLKELLSLMLKNITGKNIAYIWLAIEGDCRKQFIEDFENEVAYQRLGCSGLFALIKYFDRHPTAAEIILEYMKHTIGFEVEKNFYVNMEILPKSKFELYK